MLISVKDIDHHAVLTGNGFAAGSTTLGEEFAEAVGTIRFVVPRCEPLAGKRLLTMGASEALPVPRVITISDSTLSDDLKNLNKTNDDALSKALNLIALDTLGGELFFITFGTVDVVLLWDERFGADGVFASAADETFLVPLTGLVLHLFHT